MQPCQQAIRSREAGAPGVGRRPVSNFFARKSFSAGLSNIEAASSVYKQSSFA
jgi:hypothetical protein